jgi:hypothetical protein
LPGSTTTIHEHTVEREVVPVATREVSALPMPLPAPQRPPAHIERPLLVPGPRLEVPPVISRRTEPERREPDVVISIGRIEVKAPPAAPTRAVPAKGRDDVERLEHYRQERMRGRRPA